jgi:sugar lactone lactonase YvrE
MSTIAGLGIPPTSMPGTAAVMRRVASAKLDAAGDLYFAGIATIYRLDLSGNLTVVAGTGVQGFSGDNGPALSAQLSEFPGAAVDSAGNLYIGDEQNYRVRRVSPDGIITTVAGNGVCCTDTAPSGVATNVEVAQPTGLAVDKSGNLFIADASSNSIRMVDRNGLITTVAGGNGAGYSGDGQPATRAQLNFPGDLTFDAAGSLYVADWLNYRIRKISTGGIITTVAGNGTTGSPSDGIAATAAQLGSVSGVAVDPSGNMWSAKSLPMASSLP